MTKLTPAKRRVLQYMVEREYVSLWPIEILKSPSFRDALEGAGLIEKCGKDHGAFGFVRFCITDSGRAALSANVTPIRRRKGTGI